MLTGKAKEDFKIWYINHIRKREDIGNRYFDETLLRAFWGSGLINQNAFIIEWLDSVGICISIEATRVKNDYGFDFYIYYNNFGKSLTNESFFINRQEATEKAIEKANILYNENNK